MNEHLGSPYPAGPMPENPQPIDPSLLTLDLIGIEGHLSWSEVFGNDHPVSVEIGSGKGLFLQNAASQNPNHNYMGVELAKKYAGKAVQRAAKHRLMNVRVWPGDALKFMARHVPPKSLEAVHVYFPDPWWKARHKKRRVFRESLVVDIEKGLRDGGDLWVATDVEEYFGVITSLMETHPRFARVPWEAKEVVEHDLDYLTNFERKYRIEGRPIHRVHYVMDRLI